MRRFALLLLILPLLGCPPVRENVEGAEGGGTYIDAFINYRHLAMYQVYVAYLIIPREEEEGTFTCDNGSGYGWYDDDGDYFSQDVLRGEETDWTGDYPSFYDPECADYYGADYSEVHCRTNSNGNDPEGGWLDDNLMTFEITSWDDNRVDGTVDYGNDLSERFRATNCGEQTTYYYEERAVERARPDAPERPRGSWLLRFR